MTRTNVLSIPGGVKALVYVAAFQPDTGERAGELNEKFPGSLFIPDNLSVEPNPLGGQDLTLRPERFAEVYAADVAPAHAAVMAASQRPVEPGVLGEPLPGEPAWRTLPSWALVSTSDRSLPPAILRLHGRAGRVPRRRGRLLTRRPGLPARRRRPHPRRGQHTLLPHRRLSR